MGVVRETDDLKTDTNTVVVLKKRNASSLTLEQQQWYDWACMTGVCINAPVKHLPIKMGVLAVRIPIKDRRPFDPPHDLVAIDVAMREYPILLQ